MAELAGISRNAYLNLETGAAHYCQRDTAEALAKIFGLAMEELLDDYHRFLYQGQGQAIRSYRQQLGMGKKPFARYLGVSASHVRNWEAERKQVSRKSWEKYFRGRISFPLKE